jgi:hypothetical protein
MPITEFINRVCYSIISDTVQYRTKKFHHVNKFSTKIILKILILGKSWTWIVLKKSVTYGLKPNS